MPPTEDMAEWPVVLTEALTRVFRSGFLGKTRIPALADLSLEVAQGEVLALLGPNGSGKTTFLKLLLGLIRPTGGRARVLGRSPGHPEALARIGYMAEAPAFLPLLTGEETLHLASKAFGLERNRRIQVVAGLLERFQLREDARRAVGEYSQGMRKRVALAQALVNDPDLLLLDEPTAGLDPAFVVKVQQIVKERAEAGKSVILSSHLLSRVEEVATKICILHKGKAVRTGTLRDVAGIEGVLDLRVRGENGEAVVKFLEEGGFEVESCRIASRSLRDVFLSLTGEDDAALDPGDGTS